jgi:hypothetical protein
MNKDFTYYLQKTIAGQIVWINAQESISETEKFREIKSLIGDLNYSYYNFEIDCFKTLPPVENKVYNICESKMVLTHGKWVCPCCGHTKPAIKIQDVWFEDTMKL